MLDFRLNKNVKDQCSIISVSLGPSWAALGLEVLVRRSEASNLVKSVKLAVGDVGDGEVVVSEF